MVSAPNPTQRLSSSFSTQSGRLPRVYCTAPCMLLVYPVICRLPAPPQASYRLWQPQQTALSTLYPMVVYIAGMFSQIKQTGSRQKEQLLNFNSWRSKRRYDGRRCQAELPTGAIVNKSPHHVMGHPGNGSCIYTPTPLHPPLIPPPPFDINSSKWRRAFS